MSLFRTLDIHPGYVALARTPGEPTQVLEPGRRRLARGTSYQVVDVRDRLDPVAPQEVLTADGVTVKVSATLRWAVTDAVAFTESVVDAPAVVYLAVQVALREAVATLDAEPLARSGRTAVGAALTAAAREAGVAVGVGVREVVVKDVVLPRDLRDAYAEVVTGRQRALAQLEAARAETAALRSLANGAKLLDDHPALARLRLVQSLPLGSSVTLGSVDPGD